MKLTNQSNTVLDFRRGTGPKLYDWCGLGVDEEVDQNILYVLGRPANVGGI